MGRLMGIHCISEFSTGIYDCPGDDGHVRDACHRRLRSRAVRDSVWSTPTETTARTFNNIISHILCLRCLYCRIAFVIVVIVLCDVFERPIFSNNNNNIFSEIPFFIFRNYCAKPYCWRAIVVKRTNSCCL